MYPMLRVQLASVRRYCRQPNVQTSLRGYKKEYVSVREQHQRKAPRTPPVTLEAARANKWQTDWANYTPPQPLKPGVHVYDDVSIATLRQYIDWTPFFMTWSLSGKFPAILDHELVGEEARRLYADANAWLDRFELEGLIAAKRGVWRLSCQ